MSDDARRRQFHLEIEGLEAFATFVAILRGDDLSKLPELVARLQKSNTALAAAEAATAHANRPTPGG